MLKFSRSSPIFTPLISASQQTRSFSTSQHFDRVRTRYAPSPTGMMHIGGLRTALYNYLYAKQNEGDFLLRIEDTDKNREVDGSIDDIINMMKWAGLQWDEGPGSQQEKTLEGHSYFQSHRLEFYHKYIDQLLESGDAYPCFCTTERLQEMRIQLGGQKYAKAKYDRFCPTTFNADQIKEKQANGESYIIRMRVPKGKTSWKDQVHGKVIFDNDVIDDQVILKNDGFPTYHFANVVDDHMMQISHVIRGEEWLPSTPKHLILYDMLGFEKPEFAHLPLLLNQKGQKLSKRFGDVSVNSYIEKGFLPEALMNSIALLGWNPPQANNSLDENDQDENQPRHEVMTIDEMISQFNLGRISKSGAKFDQEKLQFFNSMHIRLNFNPEMCQDKSKAVGQWREMLSQQFQSDQEVMRKVEQMADGKMLKVMAMMSVRMRYPSDINNHKYLWQEPDYQTELGKKFLQKLKKTSKDKSQILTDIAQVIEQADGSGEWTSASMNKICSTYLQDRKDSGRGLNNEDVYYLIRYALSGNPVGAPIGEIAEVIGKQQTGDRVRQAANIFQAST